MLLIMFGALLVLCGILYMARTAIWWGSLSRPRSSGPVPDTLEPSRRGMRFLGLGANWPGIPLMAIGAVLLLLGSSF
jgi:sulfite exporter TauE/SafE